MNNDPLPLNILIADDHQMITDGLSHILASEKSIGKIHVARNGREAVAVAASQEIDVIIMDLNMPQLGGAEATEMIKKATPDVKIIVVSMLGEPSVVDRLLKLGADAFINKDAGKDELMRAIEKVMHGEKYVSPEISMNFFTHLRQRGSVGPTGKHLTKREIEIIGHISHGLTNNEIATKLFLSSVTVDTHRKNILAKLGLKNTASLIRYAMENKLL